MYEVAMRNSSVPLAGGGDTHIHVFGKAADSWVVTTSIPIDKKIGTLNIQANSTN